MDVTIVVALDACAVQDSADLIRAVNTDQLADPTPCASWDLTALLAHMTAQHHGFAAAALGRGNDRANWQEHPTADPIGDYLAACDEVISAFADSNTPDRIFDLPEIRDGISVPAATAIGFHLVDYVVHSWDVAKAVGRTYQPAPDLAVAALQVAQAVPNGPERSLPGASFAPALPGAPGSELSQILRLLGRSPTWPR